MDNSIQIPLDLPDVRVLSVSKTERGHWLIRISVYPEWHEMSSMWSADYSLPWL